MECSHSSWCSAQGDRLGCVSQESRKPLSPLQPLTGAGAHIEFFELFRNSWCPPSTTRTPRCTTQSRLCLARGKARLRLWAGAQGLQSLGEALGPEALAAGHSMCAPNMVATALLISTFLLLSPLAWQMGGRRSLRLGHVITLFLSYLFIFYCGKIHIP